MPERSRVDLYRRVRRVDVVVDSLRFEPGTVSLVLEPKMKSRLKRMSRKVAKQNLHERLTARELVNKAWKLLKQGAHA